MIARFLMISTSAYENSVLHDYRIILDVESFVMHRFSWTHVHVFGML